MKKSFVSIILAAFAISAVSFAAEGTTMTPAMTSANTNGSVVVHKAKKMKKRKGAKKGKKAEKAAPESKANEGAPAAAPAAPAQGQ